MQPKSSKLRRFHVKIARIMVLLMAMEMMGSGFVEKVDGLTMNYYLMSCPVLDLVVQRTVIGALNSNPALAAGLLRMHFHDCFIQGCDGSVLIDSTKENTAEKDSPANLSLRGYEVIDAIKEELEDRCPGVVSCADILAMAAKEAVFWTGGPYYEIGKGRKDGTRSKIEDTRNLPPPSFNASDLITMFNQRGFTAREMVALSGAHTLGVARCSSFKSRLSGDKADAALDSNFKSELARTCGGGDNAEQAFDATRSSFDNLYFKALMRNNGVLTSDQTLFWSSSTRGIVRNYAFFQEMFFMDFQQAMVKMGNMDVKEGSRGEVRQNCRRINEIGV